MRNVEKEKRKKQNEKMRRNLSSIRRTKGITLIALVITIIVLLILAGVTIAALAGDNGILSRATDAREQTDIAEEKEKVALAAQAALIDNNGREILQQNLEKELENGFGKNKYSVEEGENAGEQGYIVTITDTGRRYFVSKNGNVEQMIPAPIVTHTINPDTQVAEGEKITITINATAIEGEITKITKPDGTSVEKTTTTTYEVEENGEYKFIVEQSNGGKTTYIVEITNGKYVEKFSDIYNSTQQYTKNGQTAWIPAGFAVGTTYGINDIENGLVITDAIDENHYSTGNEFVWIPVEVDEMAKLTSGTDANGNPNYQGKLYDFPSASAYESKEKTNYGQGTTTYREPDTLLSSSDGNETYLNIIKEILTQENANKYADITSFKNTIQEDFNAIIKSVEKYDGFYVSRYEMSKSTTSNTAASVANVTPLVNDSSNMWYGLYAYGKTYNTDSVESSMIWGSQYDAMMRWMQSGEDKIDVTKSIGNSRNTGTTTGTTKTDVIRNIYDLYGCYQEWTLEVVKTARVYRGR